MCINNKYFFKACHYGPGYVNYGDKWNRIISNPYRECGRSILTMERYLRHIAWWKKLVAVCVL